MTIATIKIGTHHHVQGDLGDMWYENGVEMASVAFDGKLYVGKLVSVASVTAELRGWLAGNVLHIARNTAHHDDQDHDMTPIMQRGGEGV
jgi:hypothetical protein